MCSFWRQREPSYGVLMGFKEVHFEVPYRCIIKRRYDTILERAGDTTPWTPPSLYFNCRSKYDDVWARPDLQEQYKYLAYYPEGHGADPACRCSAIAR